MQESRLDSCILACLLGWLSGGWVLGGLSKCRNLASIPAFWLASLAGCLVAGGWEGCQNAGISPRFLHFGLPP